MTETNVPRLRFKGFDGEWIENKVGNLALVTKLAGFEFSKYVKYSDEGNIVALRGLNVKNDLLDLSDVKYIDYSDFSKLKRSKLFIGDVLFTYVGTVGNSAIVKENDKFYLAPNVALIRIKNNGLSSSFFQKEISTDRYFRKVVYPLAASSSQMALSMESIRKFKFWHCSIDEQERIGSFFAKLDKLIELQTQKLEQLKKLKQGYLQKMFPQDGESVPRLRFSGFGEEWKEKKIEEVFDFYGGKSIEKYFTKYGESKVISIGSYGDNSQYIDQGIRVNENEISNNLIMHPGELSMILNDKTSNGNIIGRVLLINNEGFVINQRSERLIPKKDNPMFLYYLLNYIRKNKIFRIAQGGTQIYVNFSSVKELTVSLPDVKEQAKIGDLLNKLDINISLTNKKIDELKQQKKAYLQKMFI